jgi:hypothetical protein
MGKWRTLFESNLPPADQREYGMQYEFGPPATEDQLTATEQALGVPLPPGVRDMLSEFNGIWTSSTASREQGHPPKIAYLDTKHMSVDAPGYLAKTDNPLPPRKALRQVVWVAQSNGFGGLWGVCAADIGKLPAGTVVRLDHEAGKLKAVHPSLAEFVRAGRHDDSK